MNNYATTVVKNRAEYVGKKLLLITPDKAALFQTKDGNPIEIEIDSSGELFVYDLSRKYERENIDISLSKLGQMHLGLRDPSVLQMLGYFVLPEMEVERIFNNLRYKYLQAIYISNLNNPDSYFRSQYNNAFQALAGINVYQGNTKERKSNDSFWLSAGFTQKAKDTISFEKERKELSFILAYLRHSKVNNFNRIYGELIAMKPGFHELMIHNNYFEESSYPKGTDIRSQYFRLLRGIGDLSNTKLKALPHEINSKSFFSYASCNVTEGPFVYRKKVSVSYYDEIRKIKSKTMLQDIKNNFYYLDYNHSNVKTLKDLNNFLVEAKKFIYFM